MVQRRIWEDEIPEWLNILNRLNEVNAEDADIHFIKDLSLIHI